MTKKHLESESDVEQKVIYPLLSDASFLAIPERHIKTKNYLPPREIDKIAGKSRGYFPDYSIWVRAFPVLIIEAKDSSVQVEVGYREASLYAQHLNSLHRHNLNPAKFILASNGIELVAGYWDSKPKLRISVSDIEVGTQSLEDLISFIGFHSLLEHALDCQKHTRKGRFFLPYSLAGGQPILNGKIPPNTFSAEIAPTLNRFFASSDQYWDQAIVEKAYVSGESQNYDNVLDALLKDRVSERNNPMIQNINPQKNRVPRLDRVVERFNSERPQSGALQLVTGHVGAGKSLFLRRYKEVSQPKDHSGKVFWAFVDYNNSPPSLRDSQEWLCSTFIDSFRVENPDFDMDDYDSLMRIFSQEIQNNKGIYKGLEKIGKTEVEKKRLEDLEKWKNDPITLAQSLCRHFLGDMRKAIVVVMDNVDKKDLNDQLDAFQISLWFKNLTRSFVILQLRDETYERYKEVPPLDTYRTGIIFHIMPPSFTSVVARRLELSLEFLSKETPDIITYVLETGMKISYPNTRSGEFLKEIYEILFIRKKNISRVLQGVAGNDIRRALNMFLSILTSGHLSDQSIASNTIGAGSVEIPESRILRILMRTDYKFFSEQSGFISNIFYFAPDWESADNFMITEVLFFLADNRKIQGEIGLEGYFSILRICDELQSMGYVQSDVISACNWLTRKGLIQADNFASLEVSLDNCVRISSSGFMHLMILSERLEYVHGVLTTTPVFEQKFAQEVSGSIQRELRKGFELPSQKSRLVKEFCTYLEYQLSQKKLVHPNFGREASGANYIIGKIGKLLSSYNSKESPILPDLLS